MSVVSHSEAIEQINDGDILFFHNPKHDWYGALINYFTEGVYSHAAIAVKATICDITYPMVLETRIDTVRRILPLNYYNDRSIDVVTPLVPWNDYGDRILSQIGKIDYSWMQAAGIGINEKTLKHYNRMLLPITFGVGRGEVCSDYIAQVQGIEPHNISPQKLFQLMIANGCTIKTCIRHL